MAVIKDGAQWGSSKSAHFLRAVTKLNRSMVGAAASVHDLTLALYEIRAERLAHIAMWRMRRPARGSGVACRRRSHALPMLR
jgi:hypothetical protein